MSDVLYPCPCCGYMMFTRPHDENICAICFWQDELYQLVFPDASGGANKPCLIVAQRNFSESGACEVEMRAHVRQPKPHDQRDFGWRPLDPNRDRFLREDREEDQLLWRSVMHTDPCLYYWRPEYWLLAYPAP